MKMNIKKIKSLVRLNMLTVDDCNTCFTESLKGEEFLKHDKGGLHPKCLLCQVIIHTTDKSINGSHKSCYQTRLKRNKKPKKRSGRPKSKLSK